MRIQLRNLDRQVLYSVQVDEKSPPGVVKDPSGVGPQVSLNWDEAFEDDKHLRRCPVCSCRELFVRKDFPQLTGFVIIVAAAVLSIIMFGMGYVRLSIGVLVVVAVLDALIFFFTPKCLVCYRCRSEFRDIPIRKEHRGWDLATGEKYKTVVSSADKTDGEVG